MLRLTHTRVCSVGSQLRSHRCFSSVSALPLPGETSDIRFAQTREDPLIDSRVARLVSQRTGRSDLRVLVLASGGCTPLSLLGLPYVSEVHAVDANPAQLQLLRLKQALVRSDLTLQESVDFLGSCTPDVVDPETRRGLYSHTLRPLLPAATASFWDDRLDHIDHGVNRCGRFEHLFRLLSAELAAEGIDPISNPAEAIEHPQWLPTFQRVMNRAYLTELFGPEAVNYSMSQEFGDHFARRTAEALTKFNPVRNYFMFSKFKDTYASAGQGDSLDSSQLVQRFQAVDVNGDGFVSVEELQTALAEAGTPVDRERADGLIKLLSEDERGVSLEAFLHYTYSARDLSEFPHLQALLVRHQLPPYLQPSYRARINELGVDRLSLHDGFLNTDTLEKIGGKFDLIQTSNITDWMPPDDASAMMDNLKSFLNPSGAVISRRLNGDQKLAGVVSKSFAVDPGYNSSLEWASRCFFYPEVVVGLNEPASRSGFSGVEMDAASSKSESASSLELSQHPWWSSALSDTLLEGASVSVRAERRVMRPTPNWICHAELAKCESFDEAIHMLETSYHFASHPYMEWMNRTADREAFAKTQIPFRYAVERWSQSVAAVIAKIPTTPGRLHIYENLAEEHGFGELNDSHVATFAEYLRALGVEEEAIRSALPPIHIHSFNESLLGFTLARSAYAGAGALGIIELLYVGISEQISKTIVERNWVKPGTQRHYETHAELDIVHARDLLDVARPGWQDENMRLEVASGMCFAAHIFWNVYGGMLVHGHEVADSSEEPK